MATSTIPIRAPEAFYAIGTPPASPVRLILLAPSVTSLSASIVTVADLPGKLPTTGSYPVAGIDAGMWPIKTNTTNVLELSLPGSTWTSNDTYTLAFRWVVVTANGVIASASDMGATVALTGDPLYLQVAESAYIPGSYPVTRWRRL